MDNLHLLLTSNHKQKHWRGVLINMGQKITSQDHLAKELGLSRQKIRSALNNLQTTNEITSETNNKYTLITILKWQEYQSKKPTEEPANNQQDNQRATTNKNDKEDKKIKKDTEQSSEEINLLIKSDLLAS